MHHALAFVVVMLCGVVVMIDDVWFPQMPKTTVPSVPPEMMARLNISAEVSTLVQLGIHHTASSVILLFSNMLAAKKNDCTNACLSTSAKYQTVHAL